MKLVSQSIIDARAQGKPRVSLFQFHFAQGTLNVTDAPFDINWQGVVGAGNYLKSGLILKADGVQSKTRLLNVKKAIQMSGADYSLMGTVLGESQVNRVVLQFHAYLDENYNVIDEPYLEWQGIITDIDSSGGLANPKITINTATVFDDFDRRSNRTTTMGSQQAHFPNDTGMRFAAEVNEDTRWGSE